MDEVFDITFKPLDDVKTEIAADLRKQKAGKKYLEVVETSAKIVCEQPDSLKPVADKLGLNGDRLSTRVTVKGRARG